MTKKPAQNPSKTQYFYHFKEIIDESEFKYFSILATIKV